MPRLTTTHSRVYCTVASFVCFKSKRTQRSLRSQQRAAVAPRCQPSRPSPECNSLFWPAAGGGVNQAGYSDGVCLREADQRACIAGPCLSSCCEEASACPSSRLRYASVTSRNRTSSPPASGCSAFASTRYCDLMVAGSSARASRPRTASRSARVGMFHLQRGGAIAARVLGGSKTLGRVAQLAVGPRGLAGKRLGRPRRRHMDDPSFLPCCSRPATRNPLACTTKAD